MPVSASRLLVADRALWRACQSESGVAVAWLGLGLKTPAYLPPPPRDCQFNASCGIVVCTYGYYFLKIELF